LRFGFVRQIFVFVFFAVDSNRGHVGRSLC
jgi:hypothetical protein